MENNLELVFRNVLSCVEYCVLAGGIAVCIVHRHLSRWTWLIALGFVSFIATGVLQQLVIAVVNRPGADWSVMRYVFGALSVFSLLEWIILITGLGLTLSDLNHQMKLWAEMSGPKPPSAK